MSKKKEYIQQGLCRLNRLETIKEFMVADLASGTYTCATPDEAAQGSYEQAVACWEILCENEKGR